MSVVRQEDVDEGGLDFSADAMLPEEVSPYHPALENRPLLYVQILDEALEPRAGLAYEVDGAGLSETRSGTTDENGELCIDDCAAGIYELRDSPNNMAPGQFGDRYTTDILTPVIAAN